MNALEHQTELHAILELLCCVSSRASQISESTKHAQQVTLEKLAEEANEARQRLSNLLSD